MTKKETPPCCVGCLNWERFGEECWVYWEGKKTCTQHTSLAGDSLSMMR